MTNNEHFDFDPQRPIPRPPYGDPGPVPLPRPQHDGSLFAAQQPVAVKQQGSAKIVGAAVLAAVMASAGTAGLLLGPLSDELGANNAAEQTVVQTPAAQQQKIATSTSQNPNWQAVGAVVAPSVVAISVTTGQGQGEGSGVIMDAEGHILTNNHVVEGANDDMVTVTLNDGTLHKAKIVGLDPATDLAVIKVVDVPADLSPASFSDSSAVVVGQSVMAMGNPLGLSQTATTGIVSAIDRPVSTSRTLDGTLVVTNAVQIDAAVNPGNSGGPLFDAQGEVIGITSSIATASKQAATAGSIGLGFAIPANLAQHIGGQLITDGVAQHAFLGVSMLDGTATSDGTTQTGAVVKEVGADSPAAKAGFKAEDVIVSIDGKKVTGSEFLTGYVRERQSADTVQIGVVRDGKAINLDVTLAEKVQAATTNPQQAPGQGSQDPTNPNNLPDLGQMFPNLPGNGN